MSDAQKILEIRLMLRKRGSTNDLNLKQWRRIVRKYYN